MGGRGGSSGMGFSGTGNATRSEASDDWFEYENANLMVNPETQLFQFQYSVVIKTNK